MHLLLRFVAVVACLVSLLGCGGGNAKSGSPVSGNVTLDGSPLDYGTISFSSIDDPKLEGSAATIQDGKYQIPADNGLPPGKYRVSISAPSGGPTSSDPNEAMAQASQPTVERVADRYNKQTELEATITAGANSHDFDVKSK